MKVLVTPTSIRPDKPSAALERLRAFASELVFNPHGRPLTADELLVHLPGCDGILAGLDYLNGNVLRASPGLKAISRYGVGYDRVDLVTASELGIVVTNTPGANAQAVAELACALMFAAARNVPMLVQKTKEGEWVRSTGIELCGKTLAILGLGAIGRRLARMGQGLGMTVIAYDPYIDDDYCAEHNIRSVSQAEAFATADVVSLHLPLTDQTHHLVNEDVINTMKNSAILINTARGGIIDEDAAYAALLENRLGFLCLDAFENEPPGKLPMFELDNVIVTPHTAALTFEATANMANMAVDNLIAVLSGEPCRYIVHS